MRDFKGFEDMARKIGILGAGQLAYYLALAAKEHGMQVHIAGQSQDEPAFRVADKVFLTVNSEASSFDGFLESVDLLVFENEWLAKLPLAWELVETCPKIQAMQILSNKMDQKNAIKDMGLSTPRYVQLTKRESSLEALSEQMAEFKRGFVLKYATGGYDGLGVFAVSQEGFQQESVKNGASRFLEHAWQRNIPIFAEEFVTFDRELALVTTRSTKGDFAFYPLVESIQDRGTCKIVFGPIAKKDLVAQAEAAAKVFAEKIGLFGTFAIEFFETQGKLHINEVSPRVHNSGHISLDASPVSQFDNHIRGVLGGDLGLTHGQGFFAMVNILGPESYSGAITPPENLPEGCVLHWYGKSESRPRRKLGHINIAHSSSQEGVKEKWQKALLALEKWEASYDHKK